MRTSRRILVSVFFAMTIPAVAMAQRTATASVLVAQGLAVTQTIALNFGDVAAGGGGSVTLTPAGGLSSLSATPANPLVHMGGTVTAGRFRVFNIGMTGQRRFSFTVTSASTTLSNTAGAGPDYQMAVDTFTNDAPPCPPCSRTQPSNGHQAFVNVGATLRVKPTQAAGNYVGTYVVRIDEQ
jgi:hypothetical protein